MEWKLSSWSVMGINLKLGVLSRKITETSKIFDIKADYNKIITKYLGIHRPLV